MNKASEDIIDVVASVVAQMTPIVEISSIEAVGDNWKLNTCKTQWLTFQTPIVIDSVTYRIVDYSNNSYITVSGSVEPTATEFQLDAPDFFHGAYRKVSNARNLQKDLKNAFVYLPIPTANYDNNIESDYAYHANIRPIFLIPFDSARDTIDQQHEESIKPMEAMASAFIDLVNEDLAKFKNPNDVEQFYHPNFGDPKVWGNDKFIFDQNISGVQLAFTLDVYDGVDCSCDATPTNFCASAQVKVNGDTYGSVASGGSVDIPVEYEGGGTVPTTIVDSIVKVGDPSDATYQNSDGSFTQEIASGGSYTAPDIVNQVNGVDQDPIPANTSTDYIVLTPDPDVYYNKPLYIQTESYYDFDSGWLIANRDINSYNNSLPENALLQQIDYTDLTKLDRLVYPNRWGHKFRFTGYLTGGYYNPDDGNYYDKNGVLSDEATEFPPFSGTIFKYIEDNLTGGLRVNRRLGQHSQESAIDLIESYNSSFFAAAGGGFNVPCINDWRTLFDVRYLYNLYDRKPFDWQIQYDKFWTCERPLSDPISNAFLSYINSGIAILNKGDLSNQAWAVKSNFLTGTVGSTIVNNT